MWTWLLTLILFAVSGVSAHSAGLPPACAKILLEQNFEIANAELFLSSAAQAVETKIPLPYKMTTGYTVRLVRLQGELFGARSVYLSHADKTQVIPSYAYVESWHNMIRKIEGFHFTLGFESEASRKKFVEDMHYQVLLDEGRLTVKGRTEYTVALSPEQFSQALQLQADAKHADIYEPATRRDLEALSDYSSLTESGRTRYYFKGTEVIGYGQGGKFYRLKKPALKPEIVNFASHYNILLRQRGGSTGASKLGRSRQVSLDPQEQFAKVEKIWMRTLLPLNDIRIYPRMNAAA